MTVKIGEKAPNFGVSEWVQGAPTNFDQEKDHIVLLEVFQVNCPGCFMHAIPEAINIYEKYKDDGVRVLGLATAFEDFDKNTLDNLKMLAETGEVVGDTKNALSQYGQLQDGNKLSFKIPFPLGMDNLTKNSGEISQEKILEFMTLFMSLHQHLQEFIQKKEKKNLTSNHHLKEMIGLYSVAP